MALQIRRLPASSLASAKSSAVNVAANSSGSPYASPEPEAQVISVPLSDAPSSRPLQVFRLTSAPLLISQTLQRSKIVLPQLTALEVTAPGPENAAAASDVPPRAAAASAPRPLIGYLQFDEFSYSTLPLMQRALAAMEHDRVSGYILDLRGNLGGVVPAGVGVASLFLEPGQPILGIHRATSEQAVVVDAALPHSLTTKPLVVLVDDESASASEIVTGALMDNGRATVIGATPRTFGKGRIQSIFELHADGSALYVTTALYKTPSGASVDHVGITPQRFCMRPGPGPATATVDGVSSSKGKAGPSATRMGGRRAIVSDPCFLEGAKIIMGRDLE